MPTTFEVILAAVHAVALMLYASSDAREDALDISLNLPINHGRLLASRIMLSGYLTVVIGLSMWCGSHSWLSTLSLIPIGWAAWVITFRFVLNGKRGLPPTYVSRSNRYDSAFIASGEALDVNPGALAYTAEALVLGIGVLMLCL